MRIALFNYGSSGLFHYAASILHALLEQPNDDQFLFFTSRFNNLTLLPSHPRLHVVAQKAPHHLPKFFLWSLNVQEQKHIKKEILSFQPDVIHITDEFPIYPLHHFTLRRFPLVFTQHDPVSHRGERYQIITTLLQHYLQSVAIRIVVHGDILKNQLVTKKLKIASKIRVVPLAEQSLLLKSSSTSFKKIPRSILFFGRIVEYKGLDVLLKALVLLQNKNIAFHLTIAGPGDMRPYTALLNQIKNKEAINIYIPDDNVASYFQRSEIIVLPYREATQSSVATLALSAGVPIIASRVGALPEILTNHVNSLLVTPENPEELAHSIKLLLENPMLQRKLIQGGKKTIEEKLSWLSIGRLYRHIYDEAV